MADIKATSLGGVPKGTTAQRPTSPAIGDVFYNGTLGCLDIYTSQGWVANSAPPAIPTIGNITYSGTGKVYNNSSASVAFSPGEGGGLPNSYRATSNPGGFSTSSSASPIVVSGLQSGVSYTFSVTGTNNFGTSAASANSSSITATTVPDAPVIGSLSYVSNTSLSLSFTAGSTGGSSITNYKYSTDGTNYTALSPAQTTSPLSLSGLTAATNYAFYIKAVNANGDSVSSSISNNVFTGPTVSGGTLTSDSTYYYRTFTETGTLTVSNSSLNTDTLIVAGGGGGGYQVGGGGGAGGYVQLSNYSIPVGSSSITIGSGGAGGTGGSRSGNGIDTTFVVNSVSLTATGGGGGSNHSATYNQNTNQGWNGGSGGGGSGDNNMVNELGGSSTQSTSVGGQSGVGFGNSGGQGRASNWAGGGGGGAAAAGSNSPSQSVGGNGGAGKLWLNGSYYAGGGGGCNNEGSSNVSGGVGGGGAGTGNGNNSSAKNGSSNTGGGGGGVRDTSGNGGTGGSGIVIVRYLKSVVGG
jgi:hypothetical protein